MARTVYVAAVPEASVAAGRLHDTGGYRRYRRDGAKRIYPGYHLDNLAGHEFFVSTVHSKHPQATPLQIIICESRWRRKRKDALSWYFK
jgi:hypothetical protein